MLRQLLEANSGLWLALICAVDLDAMATTGKQEKLAVFMASVWKT